MSQVQEEGCQQHPLEGVRQLIDGLDQQIIKLLHQRMKLVGEVASIKEERGIPVCDLEREAQILERYEKEFRDSSWAAELRYMMKQIIAGSRAYQSRILGQKREEGWKWQRSSDSFDAQAFQKRQFAYQGVQGSFGYQALQRFLQARVIPYEPTKLQSYPTFADLAAAIVQGEVDYGMLPVENSYAGTVQEVYELLAQPSLHIIEEWILPISHHLLVNPGGELAAIEAVISHPQALQQCDHFLQEHPHWNRLTSSNTAASARKVAVMGDLHVAAIASEEAASIYGLEILIPHIESNVGNRTRFVLIGREPSWHAEANKLSLCFTLPDRTGALVEVLSAFLVHQINMVHIHSQPAKTTPWHYQFFVDIEGNLQQSNVLAALELVESMTHTLKLIGNYPAGEEPSSRRR
ncbi:prephenate dehydratase [Rubeoparvulum massiliense]|uniref:prephenate dehydratase n=1 Tax=Rubeoparvulum massiliense TaxID=1631346 RepID=UPI00065E35FB|nr:prephenate dehydratase [Rubeoparvulum massiliense]